MKENPQLSKFAQNQLSEFRDWFDTKIQEGAKNLRKDIGAIVENSQLTGGVFISKENETNNQHELRIRIPSEIMDQVIQKIYDNYTSKAESPTVKDNAIQVSFRNPETNDIIYIDVPVPDELIQEIRELQSNNLKLDDFTFGNVPVSNVVFKMKKWN